jgi:hypothetical protein
MVFLTVGIAAVFLCIAGWFEFEADFKGKLLVTTGGIVVLFLGLFGFTKLMRVVVKITDSAIVRESADTPEVYRFETIDHCEIGNMLVGGRMYCVLIVALKSGDREIFCVDPSVSTQILRTRLEQRRVNVVIRTDLMSEEALSSESGDPYATLSGLQRGGNRSETYGKD